VKTATERRNESESKNPDDEVDHMRLRVIWSVFGFACVLTWPVAAPCGAEQPIRPQPGSGVVQVSGRVINHFLRRDVQDTRMVHESILGVAASGLARTNGELTTRLVPSPLHAIVDIQLNGTTNIDNNVARQRSVTILSSTCTNIHAWKRVYITESGLHPLPGDARCVSSIRLQDISARFRLVERIAWRRAGRIHTQLELAAARRAGALAAQHLDVECNPILSDADATFAEKVREPLRRGNLWPEQVALTTTSDSLRFTAWGRSRPLDDFPPVDQDHDVAVQIHQTLVSDAAETALAGVMVSDRHWLELTRSLTGQAPRPLWVHDRSEPWAVVFSPVRPLHVEFQSDGFTLMLDIEQVVRGPMRYVQPLRIATTQILDISPDGPRLTRVGNIRVLPLAGDEAGESWEEVRTFLQRKFEAVFPPDLYFDGLVPPSGVTWDKLRQLEPKEFAARKGWLRLGYQLSGNRVPSASTTTAISSKFATTRP
jgi:hypothetical protein